MSAGMSVLGPVGAGESALSRRIDESLSDEPAMQAIWREARESVNLLRSLHDQYGMALAKLVETHDELRGLRASMQEVLEPLKGPGGWGRWQAMTPEASRGFRAMVRMYNGVERQHTAEGKRLLELSTDIRRWYEFGTQYVHMGRVSRLVTGLMGILKRRLGRQDAGLLAGIAKEIDELARMELAEGARVREAE